MAKNYFKPVDQKVDFPKLEEKILNFWKENKTFEKSVESKPINKKWTFLDGPPLLLGHLTMEHFFQVFLKIFSLVFGP